MKRPLLTTLLLASLAANAALLCLHFAPPRSAPNAFAAQPRETTISSRALRPPPPPAATSIAEAWRQRDNLPAMIAALRGAGVAERKVRVLVSAAIDEAFRDRETALRPAAKKRKFWEADDPLVSFEPKLAELDLRREKIRLRESLLGPDPSADTADGLYSHLPPAKRAQAQLITEDYGVMLDTLRAQAGFLPLAAELEKFRYLIAERRRDLAALLTPEELTEHELRTSAGAVYLREELKFLEATPAEFRAIAAVRLPELRAYGQPGVNLWALALPEEAVKENREKARRLEEMKALLGEARYAELTQSGDSELRQLRDLTTRAGLPATTHREVGALRETITRQSRQIAEADLAYDEKLAAAQALVESGRAQILQLLGRDAGEVYLEVASRWLDPIARGNSVTLSPNSLSTRGFPRATRKQPPPAGAPRP